MGFHQSEIELGHFFSKFEDADKRCALEWCFKARRNNVSSVMSYIGKTMLQQKRFKEAPEYFQEAANLGDPNGQLNLALSYYNYWNRDPKLKVSPKIMLCNIITTDYKSAMAWLRKSEKQGNSEMAYYLERMYETGTGVPSD